MGDPIKEKLKSEKKIRIKQKTVPKTQIINDNSNLITEVYGVSNPNLSSIEQNPRLQHLEILVKNINQGQRNLEKIIRIEQGSALYKGLVSLKDNFLALVGRQPVRLSKYQLFNYQQRNVGELNRSLAHMTNSYSARVDSIDRALTSLLSNASDAREKRQELDKSIPYEIQRYREAKKKLEETNKEENPKQYYNALQEVVIAQSSVRKMGFEYTLTGIGKTHFDKEIENLMLQKTLFETMLFRSMQMAYQTELYQQALYHNAPIWSTIEDISTVVGMVDGAVAVLSDYNKQLNESYIGAVRDIIEIVDLHPSIDLITTSNNELRQLVSDVNSSSMRNSLTYEDN